MQRISNDLLPSTTHRVSKPKTDAEKAVRRVSFPMNVYLWEQQLLKVLPFLPHPKPSYRPVKAIEFHTRITEKYYGDGYAEGSKTDAGGGSQAKKTRIKSHHKSHKSRDSDVYKAPEPCQWKVAVAGEGT
jgi:hypothetical protein